MWAYRWVSLADGTASSFSSPARLILHKQHPDDLAAHDGAGNDRARVGDDHVARIAVVRKRMGDEAVVSGVAHRRVEKPVDLQRAALLVHLVFYRLAADRHLDHDIDVVRRVLADRDRVQIHVDAPRLRRTTAPQAAKIGGASIQSYRGNDRSAKAESDALALLTAEGLSRAVQDAPAQPAVEPDRPLVVRQRPDDQGR